MLHACVCIKRTIVIETVSSWPRSSRDSWSICLTAAWQHRAASVRWMFVLQIEVIKNKDARGSDFRGIFPVYSTKSQMTRVINPVTYVHTIPRWSSNCGGRLEIFRKFLGLSPPPTDVSIARHCYYQFLSQKSRVVFPLVVHGLFHVSLFLVCSDESVLKKFSTEMRDNSNYIEYYKIVENWEVFEPTDISYQMSRWHVFIFNQYILHFCHSGTMDLQYFI